MIYVPGPLKWQFQATQTYLFSVEDVAISVYLRNRRFQEFFVYRKIFGSNLFITSREI